MAGELRVGLIIGATDRTSGVLKKLTGGVRGITSSVRGAKSSLAAFGKEHGFDKINRQVVRLKSSLRTLGREIGLPKVGKALKGLGDGMGKVWSGAKSSALRLGVIGGAAAWAFKSQLVDTAAKFEQFRTVLETVEGSSAKAKTSMDWVSDFATRTPYELDEVMEAFVRLRAYGMDPTTGLLESLGDTASAMGKPVMQAVEAIADAVTGENERLKEFGIKAETKGDRVRYGYTDQEGKQQYKIVNKNNRKMIESTLTAIWNEKYGGAMRKQSKTWTGMVSNLADAWTRFTSMVMAAGVFDWMKGKLGALLARIDAMAKSGELERWARRVAVEVQDGLTKLWDLGREVWAAGKKVVEILQPIVEKIGPANALLGTLAAITFAPLIGSLGSLVPLVGSLGAALLSTPIGWFIAGLGGIALAAYGASKAIDHLSTSHGSLLAAAGMPLVDESRQGLKHDIAERKRRNDAKAQWRSMTPEKFDRLAREDPEQLERINADVFNDEAPEPWAAQTERRRKRTRIAELASAPGGGTRVDISSDLAKLARGPAPTGAPRVMPTAAMAPGREMAAWGPAETRVKIELGNAPPGTRVRETQSNDRVQLDVDVGPTMAF